LASPLLSSAKPQDNSVTITNNSGREIRYVYFSPVDNDNWGADQLNGTIGSGGSATINISSDQSQVKVITEDADGCFLYHTVSSSGSSTWTITNTDVPDCGN
jgi:thiamine pyrophosphate-dependent acetolactate synthase large subunit-like protein